MSIRNQNWYNLQSTRRYPLDDISTGLDDTGAFIRDDILVDCHIRFPSTLGNYLYVQGITVSQKLVTLIFGVADTAADLNGQTICAVSVVKPAAPYVNYTITPLVPGVSGWVVLGPGIDTPFSGRYTTAQQTIIQPRNARPYRPLPIPTIGKINVGTSLQGVVNLIGAAPVKDTYELITYDGRQYPAIVFRLDDALITNDYNPLKKFLGPCAQRPESGTCPKTPIETINGVGPDCAGNINIVFDGFTNTNFAGCGGADILTDISLPDVCDANKPKKPKAFKDLCCTLTGEQVQLFSSVQDFPAAGELNQLYLAGDTNTIYRWSGTNYEETDIVIDAYCWPDPTADIDIIIDETEINYPCLPTPLCVDFNVCDQTAYFVTREGTFNEQESMAPPGCGSCDIAVFAPEYGTNLTPRVTYAAQNGGGVNIAVLKNCPTDWALNKTSMAEFRIESSGAGYVAGLTLNYIQTVEANKTVTRYVAVVIDAVNNRVQVLRYVNSTRTEELTISYAPQINTWYRMYASLNQNGNNLTVNFSIATIAGADPISGAVDIIDPGELTGSVGLFSDQTYAVFNKFVVQ